MLKHLFKLMWNKKKQNALLMTEMLISFLVIFAVFTLLVFYYQNYKKPMGFEYKSLWLITFDDHNNIKNIDSLQTYHTAFKQTLRAMPEVEDLSYCGANAPFTTNTWQSGVSYKKHEVSGVDNFIAEDSYVHAMNMQLLEGRWFNQGDITYKYQPVVINSDLKEKLFGKETAVGRILGEGKEQQRVIGVVQTVKVKGDYAAPKYGFYKRIDTGRLRDVNTMVLRVKPGTDAAFEARLYKAMANYLKDANIEIEHLENKRTSINYFTLVPMIVLLIVGGFLVINVALGLFGVLWYNINKRRGEIGLRRAVGASGSSVSSQLVMETMVLATFSLIIGSFFAVQFPILNLFDLQAGIYITALLLSIIFVYALVMLCSFYPGKQAANIYPAIALHEE